MQCLLAALLSFSKYLLYDDDTDDDCDGDVAVLHADSIVDGVAVDYLRRNVYYTERESSSIWRVSMGAANSSRLLVLDLTRTGADVQPRDIVLDLHNG